jgi:hypothetical protein
MRTTTKSFHIDALSSSIILSLLFSIVFNLTLSVIICYGATECQIYNPYEFYFNSNMIKCVSLMPFKILHDFFSRKKLIRKKILRHLRRLHRNISYICTIIIRTLSRKTFKRNAFHKIIYHNLFYQLSRT